MPARRGDRRFRRLRGFFRLRAQAGAHLARRTAPLRQGAPRFGFASSARLSRAQSDRSIIMAGEHRIVILVLRRVCVRHLDLRALHSANRPPLLQTVRAAVSCPDRLDPRNRRRVRSAAGNPMTYHQFQSDRAASRRASVSASKTVHLSAIRPARAARRLQAGRRAQAPDRPDHRARSLERRPAGPAHPDIPAH